MKEQIYTIPINEACEQNSECPLCLLKRKCEEEAVEYTLGAAMMEPDFRIESNKKGYCNRHFEMLTGKSNKLGLALVMETLIEENINELEKFSSKFRSVKSEKGRLFKKSGVEELAEKLLLMMKEREESCLICDRVNFTMSRYVDVFLDMWKTDVGFRRKTETAKGFCMVHSRELLERATKKFSDNNLKEFAVFLYEKQTDELKRLSDEVHHFTLKFDYRNRDMEWGTAQDAPIRSVEKLGGFVKSNQ